MSTDGSRKRLRDERGDDMGLKDVKKYYLMKSEPDEFSFSDLEARDHKTSIWDGVRNYQARNILQGMKLGDLALFYHSNAKKETGVVGVVEITREGYPDPTATTTGHKYFDPKIGSGKGKTNPWVSVDVTFRRRFKNPVLLPSLKSNEALADMQLFKSTRLSVSCVTKVEFDIICDMAGDGT
jgi:predicted RNA-binding protein with PUA-like domain